MRARLDVLERENAELKRQLNAKPVQILSPNTAPGPSAEPVGSVVSATDKIEFFQRLFRGRTDAYPIRWESKSGKSGYSPACANEWQPLLCDKPRIKCADCPNRAFLAVTDEVVRQHLTGRIVAGVYPLLPDDQCYFLAMDFDG
ncbi:MAG: DEAD/DEAH box helicase, partial [Proteobacteria bacterium]|nr:DEAD/DEAH box helicase [Pseudomonadota bacterium]